MTTQADKPEETPEAEAIEAPPPDEERVARDAAYWAKHGSTLTVSGVPEGATSRGVEGRRVLSPIQGFGKLWQKTWRVRLTGADASPSEVIKTWKSNFSKFWPEKNFFYAPLTGISPGEVALVDVKMPAKARLSTGVLVLYADDESFTFMAPQGHTFAGWITFSAYERDGDTVAQAQVLIRAQDPLSELGLALGGHRQENRFWEHTLRSLAAHFGVKGEVETEVVCVDRRRQWKRAGNVRHSAAIRSGMYVMGTPARLLTKPLRKSKTS